MLLNFSVGDVRSEDWYKKVDVLVFARGLVFFHLRTNFQTSCSVDVTFFPIDLQSCEIRLTTQIYEFAVNLTAGNKNI